MLYKNAHVRIIFNIIIDLNVECANLDGAPISLLVPDNSNINNGNRLYLFYGEQSQNFV